MALEYHKPNLNIRQKEQALNLVVSLFRPIDSVLMNALAEVATANKVRLDVKKVSK